MSDYRCRVDDSDLSLKVMAFLAAAGIREDSPHWKIIIACSCGHQNVFAGTTRTGDHGSMASTDDFGERAR